MSSTPAHRRAPQEMPDLARYSGGMYVPQDRDGVPYIGTPMGDMPLVELSNIFYTQIAPLQYFGENRYEGADPIDVAITSNQSLEIAGRTVHLNSEHALFASNVLFALRHGGEGIRRAHAIQMGLMIHNPDGVLIRTVFSKGVAWLREIVLKETGIGDIVKTSPPTGQAVRHYINNTLCLYDHRPRDPASPDYFKQTMMTRLFALEPHTEFGTTPQDAADPLTITGNRQLESQDGAWTVSPNEIRLLNLIRLADGQRLHVARLSAAGLLGRYNQEQNRSDGLGRTVNSLNRIIGEGVLTLSKGQSQMLRVSRRFAITDLRRQRTPERSEGDDFALRATMHKLLRLPLTI